MGILQNTQTNELITLRANHTFGRDTDTNITLLKSHSTSRNHAMLVWDGSYWKLKDISSNGTFVNSVKIMPSIYHVLDHASEVQFGDLSSEVWKVMNLDAPVSCLIPLDKALPLIELHDVVVLPLKNLSVQIYFSESGNWVCDTGGEVSELFSGDKVGGNGQFWQFSCASPSIATAQIEEISAVADIEFFFTASQNEEHVSLELLVDKNLLNLKERNHHYLLLLLAKQRLMDIEKGYPELEQGWVKKELLVRMMGIAEQHINILIYRFRKQVTAQLPPSCTLSQIVERRSGELRFAFTNIHISGGFQE